MSDQGLRSLDRAARVGDPRAGAQLAVECLRRGRNPLAVGGCAEALGSHVHARLVSDVLALDLGDVVQARRGGREGPTVATLSALGFRLVACFRPRPLDHQQFRELVHLKRKHRHESPPTDRELKRRELLEVRLAFEARHSRADFDMPRGSLVWERAFKKFDEWELGRFATYSEWRVFPVGETIEREETIRGAGIGEPRLIEVAWSLKRSARGLHLVQTVHLGPRDLNEAWTLCVVRAFAPRPRIELSAPEAEGTDLRDLVRAAREGA